jgi:hypothetical protein
MKYCLKCNKINKRVISEFCSHKCKTSGYLKNCKNCNKEFRSSHSVIYCSRNCWHSSKEYKTFAKRHPIINQKPPQEFHLCLWCGETKKFDEFRQVNKRIHLGFKKKGGWNDIEGGKRYAYCKNCESVRQKQKRDERPAHRLFLLARRRAKKEGLAFNITTEYLESIWPNDNQCPILRTSFKSGMKNKHDLPTLDKVIRKKGYVKGNVAIISHRANAIKSDVDDFEIFKKLYDYTKKF